MNRKINIAFGEEEKNWVDGAAAENATKNGFQRRKGRGSERGAKFHACALLLHLKEVLTSHGRLQRFKAGLFCDHFLNGYEF